METTFCKKAADPLLHLFWKTQISILRACPPLAGVVSRSGMGAENSGRLWVKTLLRTAKQAPRAALLHLCDVQRGRVVLPRVSVPVTTRCTLHCDKCIVHVPDLKKQADIPLRDLLRDIQALLACADHIYTIILGGGEAFLHSDLDEIIRAFAESGKVSDITVESNGTLVPGAKVLAALQKEDAMVRISRYPALQPDVEKLKSALREYGIPHTHESGTTWRDLGATGRLREGSEKRRFSVCIQQLCLPYLNGKLYLCGQSAVLTEEGLIPECAEDRIDLRCVSPAAFRAQWKELSKKRVVSACSYCLGDTYNTPKIPVAVQRAASAP